MNKSFCYSESELLLPTILAIKALGGSANTDEIEEQIIKDLKYQKNNLMKYTDELPLNSLINLDGQDIG
jgi:hypothetical protein